MNILLIEDELPLQRALTDSFTFGRYEVIVAGDGEAGYRLAIEKKPERISE